MNNSKHTNNRQIQWVSIEEELPLMIYCWEYWGEQARSSKSVITNKGPACLVNGEWVEIHWDSSISNKPLHGVTHWMDLPLFPA